MVGPTNFTTNDESGIVIEGFDTSPSLDISYTHRAYPEFLERFGLTKLKDILSTCLDRCSKGCSALPGASRPGRDFPSSSSEPPRSLGVGSV
jgi:hypothetical protein